MIQRPLQRVYPLLTILQLDAPLFEQRLQLEALLLAIGQLLLGAL